MVQVPHLFLVPTTIRDIPLELLYNIFEPLDNASIRACVLVCTRWRAIAQRLAYRTPRLSSAISLHRFCDIVSRHSDIANAVRALHIRGKVNYSSSAPTPWILEVPSRLSYLLPNVHSITFDNIEGVHFHEKFWIALGGFTKVTSLTVESSRFYHDSNLRNMIFSFPDLTSLTLSNVHWATMELLSCPRWKQTLPLKVLRLNNIPDRGEYDELFKWLGRLSMIRELELIGFSDEARDLLARFLHRVADNGGSLVSINFAPTVALYHRQFVRTFPELGLALRRHKRLRELRLSILNMTGGPMAWVPRLLEDLHSLPLTHIALNFTLDLENAHRLIPEWSETNSRLQTQWRGTLRKVTLTHFPVGWFVSDGQAVHVLTSRLPYLCERKMLEVVIGERHG
uniref:Cytotoxic necrotizing factor n=1 Tax=Ganoderma boninense TaxID=34458 RepID=A0A5K1JX55_9APHY|nr:Cytotoxic necrotizing factor [Ganoderma boninense]